MLLTVDSEKVDLPPLPGEKFQVYLNRIADLLMQTQRCVGTCRLDGIAIQTIEEGGLRFEASTACAIDSVPLRVALQANIATHCKTMRTLEDECESLVTDSLLSDPRQVAAAWHGLCERLKSVLDFIPALDGLLTDEQVDSLVKNHLQPLDGTMREIAGVLNKGDIVAFSDLLEMRLKPWLGGLRGFLQTQLAAVEAMGTAIGNP